MSDGATAPHDPAPGALLHELTNQLAVVSAYARFALDALDGDEQPASPGSSRPTLREDLEEIHAASARAQTLVRELRAATRETADGAS